MTHWRLSFHGRRAGAIGIMHRCETVVEAVDHAAARIAAYDSYEHITEMTFSRIESRLRIDNEAECSFDELMESNRGGLDEKDRLAVSRLSVGKSMVLGGGAAAECRIERIA